MAFRVKDSIDVEASAEEVFEVATDFESYPEWNGAMKKVEVQEQDDDGRATKVFFEVDARLKTVSYTLSYDYSNAPESFSWSLLNGDVKELQGAYSFDEFDDVTEVSYELELDPGFPVPGIFRRQGERELKKAALDELKNRVESRD
jgi:ribosome-associated toxin RatA of RatAB toxin-antitoxin module